MLFYVVIEEIKVKEQKVKRQLVSCCPFHFLREANLEVPVAEDAGKIVDEAGSPWIQEFEFLDMAD